MSNPGTSLVAAGAQESPDEDAELKAIQAVLSALSNLDSDARSRVVDYVFKRLGLMSESLPVSASVGDFGRTPGGSFPPVAPTTGVRDIRTLTREKQPRSANEMAALVAYYVSEEAPPDERRDEIGAEEIKKYFKQAQFRLPSSPRMALVNAKNAGYLDSSAPGQYKLNPVGYNLVVHRLGATAEAGTRRKGRAKKSRKRLRTGR